MLVKTRSHRSLTSFLAVVTLSIVAPSLARGDAGAQILPTGVRITPGAAPGSHFQRLNPGLASRPGFEVDHASATALSPDGATLLVLTSGYNLNNGPDGNVVPSESTEWVFVFDASRVPPVQLQAIAVPNTFGGVAWAPDGQRFYVTGGKDDVVHTYARRGATFVEAAAPLALGPHAHDPLLRNLLQLGPVAAGIGVTADGARAVVANFENDTATVLDLASGAHSDVDLRPGPGVAGGEFPFGVAVHGNDKAYVSSMRDGELVVLDLSPAGPRVSRRIPVGRQPNRMILDATQRRLFVANANSDSVSVVDTATDSVVEEIPVTAPSALARGLERLRGANPNGLALSQDERLLFVTNGGTNSLALVRLANGEREDDGDKDADRDDEHARSRVVGLVPTGWYPVAVSAGPSGHLFVANAKSNAGPNPKQCQPNAASSLACNAANEYVWQLEKAGLLSLPLPDAGTLARLTWQVAENNLFPAARDEGRHREMMAFLRKRIKHVVYVVKENRTYDQILGDLDRGNGDPALAAFPDRITPNHHELARKFVTLDNFYDSGETSGVGWNWTMAGRTTDVIEKTQPVNYAGRGLSYDWEGTNRNLNMGLATGAERAAANPLFNAVAPLFPDLADMLPGAKDVSSAQDADGATTYLWENALRSGITLRNYGCFGDLARYQLPPPFDVFNLPLDRTPFQNGDVQFIPASPGLQGHSDPFFRGFDMRLADFWRFREWEREFDAFAQSGDLPALSLVRLPHDHFGSFADALDGLDTPDAQIADNDYALGLLVDKVSRSRFADDTLIFIVEDDAQDGPDHVDAHRSVGYVIGPYVRRGAVLSRHYTTVSMVRTIEDVLDLPHQGLTDGLAEPMSDVFERHLRPWPYDARVPAVLRSTQLPVPGGHAELPRGSAESWAQATADMNFGREDAIDSARFNRVLWDGLMGNALYPEARHGKDLSRHREKLLRGAAKRGRAARSQTAQPASATEG
jgi:YVTN family beta-propeller protein